MTRTERTYYAIFGLYCVSWSAIVPVYPLFLLSRGLDLFQINVVLAVFLTVSFVFEVPTGAFADLIGRKQSFLLSCLVRMVAYGLYAFARGFADCVVAELIDAIGSTLATGALDAWAVDGMSAEGNRRPIDRFFARAQMIARALMITAGIAAGYLAEQSMRLPWFAGAVGFAVTAACAAMWMRETRAAAPASWSGVHRSLGRTVREGLGAVRNAPVLRLLCILTLIAAFGAMPLHMLWQPRLQALTGQGAWLMGWMWALLNLASIAGSALVPRLLVRFRREHVLSSAALTRSIVLGLAGVATGTVPVVAGLVCLELGFGLSEPLLQGWMNEHIAPEQRATVLSVRAMFFTLGGGAGLVCIGLIARDFGIAPAWVVSATVLALAAPGFLILGRRARAAHPGAALIDAPPALG